MIVHWLYSNPAWLVGIVVVVGGMTLLACVGLLIFDRFVNHDIRLEHNDMVGASMAVIGTVAAILLAFIGVATWQTFSDAQTVVDREAGAIGNLYLDSYGLPADGARGAVRAHIRNYLEVVIGQEWPRQQRGAMGDQKSRLPGLNELLDINRALASFNPQTAGQANVQAQAFTALTDLFTARRLRIAAANGHVSLIIWVIILLGTAATVGCTYFFGSRNTYMHLAVTGSVAASLALVILLIIFTDYPFRGAVSVSSESYETVRDTINSAGQEN